MSDPGKYRTKEEVDQMMQSDPLHLFSKRLMEQERVTRRRARGHRQGRPGPGRRVRPLHRSRAPFPPPESLYEDVYVRSPYMNMKGAEKDPAWRAALARRPRAREVPGLGPGRGQGGRLDMALITMREALNQALREEMTRDESVFLLGEEVGAYQGAYKITQGLLAQFGEWRVRDTPIAEEVIAGHRGGGRVHRPATHRGDDDLQLLDPGPRPDRQPRRQVPVHVRAARSAAPW